MDYKNSEMKVDQLVNYLNDNKINLSPAFQRGHVWNIKQRRKLLKNILDKKPIPAIFLYKEATGAKYSYNILDGKQRLESIILYVSNARDDFKIQRWRDYFLSPIHRNQAEFEIEPNRLETSFENLDESIVRDFREYSIPTIEILLDEKSNSSLSEIISLFIDINQQGVAVDRFNIVKALCLDSVLLKSVFDLIAQKQRRGKDLFYKMIDNNITKTLKNLRDVQAVTDNNYKIDKMWEHLLEICLFGATGNHRKPLDIIKGFINRKAFTVTTLNKRTVNATKQAFDVLYQVSRKLTVQSPLFSDYTYFYSVVTALIKDGVLNRRNTKEVEEKLILLAGALGRTSGRTSAVKKFITQSKLHTTDVSGRLERERIIVELLAGPKTDIQKMSK